ncbi:bifunctional hydroxymethylpyrimidine kinase/phosphomethylpyrimidine kinase [candidate division WOR-3 bacterium]|nr:bifunctional hydroxymethylpyrimidine kinase/phosphomethylpyrimidine kinase [candidate division WOR-3 bacterium]
MKPVVLTIAGSDPSGGAGIERDIKTFESTGIYGAACITAVTIQNTEVFRKIFPMPTETVEEQIDVVCSDMKVTAVKTGMLWSKEILLSVIDRLLYYKPEYVVVDPVISAGTGYPLISKIDSTLFYQLLPLATLSTPNIDEASLLSGLKILTMKDIKESARRIFKISNKPVLIKGGHIGPRSEVRSPRLGEKTDILFDGESFRQFSDTVIEGEFHGTGCCLSSAITSYLALGNDLVSSIEKARSFLRESMREANQYGKGQLVW